MLKLRSPLLTTLLLLPFTPALAQDLEPPEMTTVSGRLMKSPEEGAGPGAAYFVFQRRILEIPHEGTLEALHAMAETAVAVDTDGSFTLRMAPGNYLLLFEPGAEPDAASLEGGPSSFRRARRLTPEINQQRVARIMENAQQGLPIQDGRIGENAYVVENRSVRPPLVDFGEMVLGANAVVTVIAQDEQKKTAKFPVNLRLRGKNGDIYEPHPPTVSAPGKFTFHDVFPQPYQVFGLPVKPGPGADDQATTPSVTNGDLLFSGEPLEWKVQINPTPKDPGFTQPTPTPRATTRRNSR